MINKYAITFMLLNVGIAAIVIIILEVLDVNFSHTSFANIGSAAFAAIFIGTRFAKKENRLATDKERMEFARLCLIYITVFGILMLFILSAFIPVFDPLSVVLSSPKVNVIFVLLSFVAHYFAIKFFFGYGIKNELDKQSA